VTKSFRGNPRLLFQALPVALVMIVIKWLYELSPAPHLQLSPLLTGVIASEVFVIGFMLSGTAGDFKEAERSPGELAASLETIADECLIIHDELRLPQARECVAHLIVIGDAVQRWLLRNERFDDVMAEIRALNPFFMVFAPKIQAGFTTRLKSEQSTIRKLVLRMDTMRRTSYVSAGYLIAEVIAVAIGVLLLVTDVGHLAPTLLVVGVISYLLVYLLTLLRDLDNPFEYHGGKPGAADVNLEVLEHSGDRLRGLLAQMST
jgi:predicted membrane chloride channel (bestrophin family)